MEADALILRVGRRRPGRRRRRGSPWRRRTRMPATKIGRL
uniref:Uncharacterized protein n=1 Tax=Arundo donax TaxID=35708 RepID=A0A0A9BSL3_ARUDO